MLLFIKNMVCLRCKILVKRELEKLNITYIFIELGKVELLDAINEEKKQVLKEALLFYGLELMDDKKSILIEKIKSSIIEMIHHSNELPEINLSLFLSKKLKIDYHSMSEIFSKTTGITIENFIILHKIEKVKELITYNELNLTQISHKMNYSSVSHLSNQFKKTTGHSPSSFKKLNNKNRNNLENL